MTNTNTKTAADEIVKVLEVEDTRTFEEVDDRMVPIAGSGRVLECDRCGREHEIHATVELASGATAVVGTGCMKKHALGDLIRRQAATATRKAKRAAELVTAARRVEELSEMLRSIDARTEELFEGPLPPVVEVADGNHFVASMGDASVWILETSDVDERLNFLARRWAFMVAAREHGVSEREASSLRTKLSTLREKVRRAGS